jgi:hypothetical protein
MNKTILITRPNHDSTTDYLYHWSKPVIDVANKKRFKVLDLEGKKANRKNFESYLFSNNPDFIFLNGHGSEDKIAGYGNEILVDKESFNSKGFSNKIMYSRSCRSALVLGGIAVKGGMRAFVGYCQDFIFLIDNNYITRPYLDPVAKLFLEPSNLVPTTLIKGHTVKEANLRSKNAMRKVLFRSLSSNASESESKSAPFLLSNMSSQTVHGDDTATI